MLKRIILSIIAISLITPLPVKAYDDFYSDSEIQFYDPNACDPNGSTDQQQGSSVGGGVDYDNTQSPDTNYEVSVETDGADPSPGGDSNYQSDTSYGHNLGWKTHFVALNPGWDKVSQNKLELGDVVKITWKGKTVYAIWGDNHSGDGVHTEVSLSVKKDLGAGSSLGSGFGSRSNPVKFTIYPDTHQKIHGNPPSQSLIDQVGTEVAGVPVSSASSGSQSANSTPQACCNSDSSTALSGKNNGEKVWNYLSQKGLSDIQVAGIMGNMQQESNFDPSNTNSSSGAFGIAQWLGGRKTKLEARARSENKSVKDLGLQLDFLWSELNDDYETSVLQPIKRSNDLGQVVDIWLRKYEIPCSNDSCFQNENETRLPYARNWLNKARGAGTTDATSSDVTNNSGSNCGSSSSIEGYKNPYRDVKKQQPMRIDMGVDMGGEGPIYAIGDGEVNVVHKYNSGSGWPGVGGVSGAGGWVSYTLTSGPAKGKTVYFAENCKPSVKEGDKVASDTKICDLEGLQSSWSESGWAMGKTGTGTAAQQYGGYSEGDVTAAGVNFSDLIKKLGSPPGVKTPGKHVRGKLPDSWPTWK